MLGVMAYSGPYHDWREARIARQHEMWFAANAKLYTLPSGQFVWAAGQTVRVGDLGLYIGPGDEMRPETAIREWVCGTHYPNTHYIAHDGACE